MSSHEQKQILKMVEFGKINAKEALKLIQVLDSSAIEDETIPVPSSIIGSSLSSNKPDPNDLEEIARNGRSLWQILLWVGVSVVILAAYWLYSLVITSSFGFWFIFALLLVLFGVLFLALCTGKHNSHWLYVNVERQHGDWPRSITLGLPLPLGLASWFLRKFRYSIEGLNQVIVNEILEFISKLSLKQPVIVNFNEGLGGECIQVYIS